MTGYSILKYLGILFVAMSGSLTHDFISSSQFMYALATCLLGGVGTVLIFAKEINDD